MSNKRFKFGKRTEKSRVSRRKKSKNNKNTEKNKIIMKKSEGAGEICPVRNNRKKQP